MFMGFKKKFLNDFDKLCADKALYNKLIHSYLQYTYERFLHSDYYERYITLGITEPVDIEVPSGLIDLGVDSLIYNYEGNNKLRLVYDINKVLTVDYKDLMDFLTDALKDAKYNKDSSLGDKHSIVYNTNFVSVFDICYETYAILDSPDILHDSCCCNLVSKNGWLLFGGSDIQYTHFLSMQKTVRKLCIIDANGELLSSDYKGNYSDILYFIRCAKTISNVWHTFEFLIHSIVLRPYKLNVLFNYNYKDMTVVQKIRASEFRNRLAKESTIIKFLDEV